ncbi:MAG: TetR/AcrR family transcriptional repressor of nem operon [Psychromonas sp.]|jgi:TetR/AcrR family transcriptional repressor of nem operon|uniref:TetR/AcrR family transcriptional regulator n=1 Tax=Psychromonas sp. TaxID=1884585 RepID=UPI0039E56A49
MRNAEFDRETVLRAAMSAFMVNGYAKTSMQDLTKATGLHPGSIYCAFENKKGVLLAAIDQYQQDRNLQFQQFFDNAKPALDNLRDYLTHIVEECLSCDATKSCLLTKSLSEMGEQDDDIRLMINKHLHSWQNALSQVFDNAKAQKLLDKDCNSEFLAQYLMMGIYGLRTFSHTHPQVDILQPLADKLLRDIRHG